MLTPDLIHALWRGLPAGNPSVENVALSSEFCLLVLTLRTAFSSFMHPRPQHRNPAE